MTTPPGRDPSETISELAGGVVLDSVVGVDSVMAPASEFKLEERGLFLEERGVEGFCVVREIWEGFLGEEGGGFLILERLIIFVLTSVLSFWLLIFLGLIMSGLMF